MTDLGPFHSLTDTDKAPSLAKAIAELKAEGICPPTVEHRQVKYLNNVLEGDHDQLKRILRLKPPRPSTQLCNSTKKESRATHTLKRSPQTLDTLPPLNLEKYQLVDTFQALPSWLCVLCCHY